MHEYAIAAIGEDRPGIVAGVSRALNATGASIEDSSMTILGGHFAMLLLVELDGSEQDLRSALEPVAGQLDLLVEVRPTTSHEHGDERRDFVIAAYGPDRPGLVASLAEVLAAADVNISDFGSRLTESGLFAMWFNVSVPPGLSVEELTGALQSAGGEVSLDVTVSEAQVEAL